MDIVVGIDPGISGGIAVVNSYKVSGVLDVIKMPETIADLSEYFRKLQVRFPGDYAVYLEKVSGMPHQSLRSTWTFARNIGQIEGVVSALGYRLLEVPPRVWQGTLKCLSKGDKNVTKAKAQALYPNTKITHAIADALLIAHYGWRVEYGQSADNIT